MFLVMMIHLINFIVFSSCTKAISRKTISLLLNYSVLNFSSLSYYREHNIEKYHKIPTSK